MKRNVALFLSIIMIMVCIVPLGGCGNENDKIGNLMTEFEYACNSLDVDAILDCIHPDVTNKIKTALGLVGMFTGQDSDDMLEAISNAITGNGNIDAEDFFSSIKIEVKDINAGSSTGKVNATIFPAWDNGRSLGVVPGEDSFRKLTQEEIEAENIAESGDMDEDSGMSMNM